MKPTSGTIPTFCFRVTIPDTAIISCSAVSGLDLECDDISYRCGDSVINLRLKIGGLRRSGDITLKQCRADNVQAITEWYDKSIHANVQRRNITIELLDENQDPVTRWRAINAWPKNVTEGDSAATDFETIVLAHEGVDEK